MFYVDSIKQNKFKTNDAKLLGYPEIKDQSYVEERIQIQRICEGILADINNKLVVSEEESSTTDDKLAGTTTQMASKERMPKSSSTTDDILAGTTEQMRLEERKHKTIITPSSANMKRIRKQLIKINHLESVISQANSFIEDQKETEYLQQKIKQLNIGMEKVDELHEEILLESTEEDHEKHQYFRHSLYAEISSLAEDCSAKLQQAVSKRMKSGVADNDDKDKCQLKKIELPKFNGNYQD